MEPNLFALSLGLAGLFLIPTLGRADPSTAQTTAAHQPANGDELRSMDPGLVITVKKLHDSARTGTPTLVTLPRAVSCHVESDDAVETAAPSKAAKNDPA